MQPSSVSDGARARTAGKRGGVGALEVAVAIVISVAGLATSLASYEAYLWSGRQTLAMGRANTQRVAASEAALEAQLRRLTEVHLFTAWLEARERGDTALAEFYVRRFPADLRADFDEWMRERPFENPRADPTPFTSAAARQRLSAQADGLEGHAAIEMAGVQRSLATAQAFNRASAVLALAMFFGGIGQAFASDRVRLVLAVVAGLICAIGIGLIVTLPILTLH